VTPEGPLPQSDGRASPDSLIVTSGPVTLGIRPLALRNVTADWGGAANNWKAAMNQFAILYKERFSQVE
jgi:hypothetical protein